MEIQQEYIEEPVITPDLTIEERRKVFKKHKNKRFYKKIDKKPLTAEERRASMCEFKKEVSYARKESYVLSFFYWLSKFF